MFPIVGLLLCIFRIDYEFSIANSLLKIIAC